MIAKDNANVDGFRDDPAAHALHDRMLDVMRTAETLSWESRHRQEWAGGQETRHCTYRIWMKKPNYARMEVTSEGKLTGVLVLDGEYCWIYWPEGRFRYGFEDEAAHERTRFTSYMKEAAPAGRYSLWHQTPKLGGGMGLPVIQPSYFHGGRSSLDAHLDGVQGMAAEEVGEECCDVVEVSFMDHQRSHYLWLSRTDHLPRKLREVTRVDQELITEELWSKVAIDAALSDEMFAWEPSQGWTEFRLPDIEEGILKAGTEAPDFDLVASDGSRVTLADCRGKVVWLCIWRVGCPPCREEMPELERLQWQYGAKGLVVIGLNAWDDKQIATDFLRETEVTFPNVIDSSEAARKTACEDYQTLDGMVAVPINYVIDRDGKIVDGFYDFDRERGLTALQKLGLK